MPAIGETIFGSGFKIGPGGKGSNQSVAAARVGGRRSPSSPSSARDAFGDIARATWAKEGITAQVAEVADQPTGAAFIFVNEKTGENAIIVVAGRRRRPSARPMSRPPRTRSAARRCSSRSSSSRSPAAQRGLEIARAAGVVTVFNPAPAAPVDDAIYALCDYVTPNENEATALTGVPVASVDDARKAGDVFLAKGAGAALVTLGAAGALLHTRTESILVPAFKAGPVVETTGRRATPSTAASRRRSPAARRRSMRSASAAPSPASRSPAPAPRRRCRRSPRSRRCWRRPRLRGVRPRYTLIQIRQIPETGGY